MFNSSVRLLAGFAITLTATAVRAESVTIKGRVVDERGNPVSKATVAPYWHANGTGRHADGRPIDFNDAKAVRVYWSCEGQMVARDASNMAATDSNGTFKLDVPRAYHSLFVIDEPHHRGAVASIPVNTEKEMVLRMQKLVRCFGRFSGGSTGKSPIWTHVYVRVPTNPSWPLSSCRIAACGSFESRFEVLLPPGDYVLDAYGASSVDNEENDLSLRELHRICVRSDQTELDLGVLPFIETPRSPIELAKDSGRWNEISEAYGTRAPEWNITDAHGIAKTTRLADLRGKYVLLYFWHLSCRPCVADGIPELTQFYDEHASKKDQFEVLSFYMDWDSEIASISDLERKMQPYQKRVWSRQVSFPILLDGTRATFERYGVDQAGVSVLVDADGNLAKGGIKELKRILATHKRSPVPGDVGP